MKKAGAIFLSLLLPFSWLSAFPSAAAEPVIRQPIVRYDFSDPDHLGKDRMGRFDLVDVGNVAQGSKSNAVKSAVFNGTSALCAVPVAGRDPTDGLETLTITLWGKRSAVQSRTPLCWVPAWLIPPLDWAWVSMMVTTPSSFHWEVSRTALTPPIIASLMKPKNTLPLSAGTFIV